MDMFVQDTEGSTAANGTCGVEYCPPGIVMDYFDGNTVTGLWNYAQYYSMSDNNWDTSFGPSTPGAINVVSGNTSGAQALSPAWSTTPGAPTPSTDIASVNSSTGLGTLYTDEDPYYDDCSDGNHASNGALAALTGENIGDLLNNSKVSWGWFEGGFAPTGTSATPAGDPAAQLPVCGAAHANIGGASTADYVPHHNPFEYYASTANPAHLAPSSLAQIGYTDQANHQYDMSYFSDALERHRRRPAALRELPQGPGLPGRPPRLLGPDRRADLPGQHHQLDREVQVLAVDRDRHHLRRLGRLVRPPGADDHRGVQRQLHHPHHRDQCRSTPRCAPRSR